ncbi:MAG: thioredoxin [Anaerolineales bacterium]|jgi:thioredoxin 1|nr:thioredoxin [Anaerolineales bacterium]
METKPIHITDAEFEEKVLNADLPVLVDFWAPWCGPCLMIAPLLENIAEDYAGKVVVAKVNTDENADRAMQYGVQGIPTLLVFSGGELIREHVGAVPEPHLRELVDEVLEITGEKIPS